MGRIYKRGATWWARYSDARGRSDRVSLRTRDKEVARARLRQLELAGGPDRPADRTLGEALTHLLDTVYAGRRAATVGSYRQKARHLVRLLGADTDIADIDRVRCQGFRATRLQEGASEHTVYKEVVVLRLALAEQGIHGVVPKFSANYTPRELHLTVPQFRKLLAALAPRRRLWVMLACYLGARDSELASLRWEDVDLKSHLVRLRGTKTKRSDRVVPIPPQLIRPLKADRQPSGAVVAPWTKRCRDLTSAYWKVIDWKPPGSWTKGGRSKAGASRSIAGAPRLSPNDLRRTFASWLKQAGVDSMVVAHLLGHSSTRMIEAVYGRLRAEDYARAMAKLPTVGECARERARSVPRRRGKATTRGHSRPTSKSPKPRRRK